MIDLQTTLNGILLNFRVFKDSLGSKQTKLFFLDNPLHFYLSMRPHHRMSERSGAATHLLWCSSFSPYLFCVCMCVCVRFWGRFDFSYKFRWCELRGDSEFWVCIELLVVVCGCFFLPRVYLWRWKFWW